MSYNYKDKKANILNNNLYMFAKTSSMFEWENLPPTIPYKELEKLLQMNGYAFITKVNGELYAFSGGLGGEQDVYGNPTTIVIANPALKFNATLDLEKDGVLIINDDFKLGLTPLFNRYNTFLVENDINMMMYGYNSRTQKLISASDDKTKVSAELAIKKSIDGDLAVIGESFLFDGIKLQAPASNSGVSITNLTEFHQYIKGSLFNEIGLTANFNMKRERLTSGETEQDDANFPFVYNMLKCRMKAVEKLNEMFDLNCDVDFGSVWAKKSKEVIDDVVNNNPDDVNNPDDINNPDDVNNPDDINNPDDNKSDIQELQEIINNPESTPEDIETAKALLSELEDIKNDE